MNAPTWLRLSVSLTETRTADTGGGDYAEGDVDKRAGAFAAPGGAGSGGAGGGGGSATVTVNIDRLAEEPPTTIPDYIKSLWLLSLADQFDRRERQQEADRRHALTVQWLVVATIVIAIDSAGIAIWAWQWTMRFGWLW